MIAWLHKDEHLMRLLRRLAIVFLATACAVILAGLLQWYIAQHAVSGAGQVNSGTTSTPLTKDEIINSLSVPTNDTGTAVTNVVGYAEKKDALNSLTTSGDQNTQQQQGILNSLQ